MSPIPSFEVWQVLREKKFAEMDYNVCRLPWNMDVSYAGRFLDPSFFPFNQKQFFNCVLEETFNKQLCVQRLKGLLIAHVFL